MFLWLLFIDELLVGFEALYYRLLNKTNFSFTLKSSFSLNYKKKQ